jgi:hypothetical protein
MKKYFLILLAISFSNIFRAQDQLFKRDNTKLIVKITEISSEEIKYKLTSNLNGPVYIVSKAEVSLIIYENGEHEVINTGDPAPRARPVSPYVRYGGMMSKKDSLELYKHSQSISMNFLNFFNMEVGFIYQKDFLKNNFNIIIPLAVGLQTPSITEAVYFNASNPRLNLDRKLFEVGLGLNYYPSLRTSVNYYVGPAFRYMQYDCQQAYTYYVPSNYSYPYGGGQTITKYGTLSRYCISVTNGFIFRTRSRIILNVFGSLGFKSDVVSNSIVDPNTNTTLNAVPAPFSLYFWAGFAIGYCFN